MGKRAAARRRHHAALPPPQPLEVAIFLAPHTSAQLASLARSSFIAAGLRAAQHPRRCTTPHRQLPASCSCRCIFHASTLRVIKSSFA